MNTQRVKLLLSVLFFLTFNAHAADGAVEPNMFGQVIMMVVFGGIFYFLLWRPQSKRAQQVQSMLSKLTIGDEVVASGILGRVSKINDNFVWVTIAEGSTIIVQKSAIAEIMPKGTIKTVG